MCSFFFAVDFKKERSLIASFYVRLTLCVQSFFFCNSEWNGNNMKAKFKSCKKKREQTRVTWCTYSSGFWTQLSVSTCWLFHSRLHFFRVFDASLAKWKTLFHLSSNIHIWSYSRPKNNTRLLCCRQSLLTSCFRYKTNMSAANHMLLFGLK